VDGSRLGAGEADGEEKNIKKRIKKDIEFQENETAGKNYRSCCWKPGKTQVTARRAAAEMRRVSTRRWYADRAASYKQPGPRQR
jgi:hypothetical protein